MIRQTLTILALGLLCVNHSNGQLVQVGPYGGVRVNVPFVRVEVDPSGATYVRAPFTSVYAPGRPRWRPYFAPEAGAVEPSYLPSTPFRPPLSTEIPSRQFPMSWREVRREARAAASQFDRALTRLPDAEIWKRYLRPQDVLEFVTDGVDLPPSDIEAEQLGTILRTFEATAANRRLRRITELPGFHATRRAVGELLVAPQERTRRQLAASALQLGRELGRLNSGTKWPRWLEIPLEVDGRRGPWGAPSPPLVSAEPDLARLERVLSRYEHILRAPHYEAIASLESFRRTHGLLSAYVQSLRELDDRPEPTPAAIEELPAPTPQ